MRKIHPAAGSTPGLSAVTSSSTRGARGEPQCHRRGSPGPGRRRLRRGGHSPHGADHRARSRSRPDGAFSAPLEAAFLSDRPVPDHWLLF